MKLVLDVETKSTKREDGKNDLMPHNPENYLVSVHMAQQGLEVEGEETPWVPWNYVFAHDELDISAEEAQSNYKSVQNMMDKTTLLIGHNIKFDLQWLWSCGWQYDGAVFDTMIGEYILTKGHSLWMTSFSLKETCKRRKVALKDDAVQEWFDKGYTANQIPRDILLPYGDQDCVATGELYQAQRKEIIKSSLVEVTHMSMTFLPVLARMEFSGAKIDTEELNKIRDEYMTEKAELENTIQTTIRDVMGVKPYSHTSPEQLSQVIYSRKPKDKKAWKEKFFKKVANKQKPIKINRYMPEHVFKQVIKKDCSYVFKHEVEQCHKCKGEGKYQKYRKDGKPYSDKQGKPIKYKCPACEGTGVLYIPTQELAGLCYNPENPHWITDKGFTTSKDDLELLRYTASQSGDERAEKFFEAMIRLNAVNTYLSSFVEGITKNVREDGILHANFNQTTTATGRLSSSGPNMQNMPRGKTFPVKRAFVSRFDGGSILDVDFSQLEFRVAGELSGCKKVAEDIEAGVDVHRFTASILNDIPEEEVTNAQRTHAKADTFKPLYGGEYGTPAQEKYYKEFLEKYDGVKAWHKVLQDTAINTGVITIPSGRQYAFPNTERRKSGEADEKTRIVNYPVQGFATGDIVPLAVIHLARALKGLKSVLFNTVHDSICVDVHPDEITTVPKIVHDVMKKVDTHIESWYNYKMKIPLDFEISMGVNWLDQEPIYEKGKWSDEFA